MSDIFYLVDNNVLGKLKPSDLQSAFFIEYCRVPDEVMHEAGAARAASLQALRYPTTTDVLRAVQAVMATVRADDVKLVNLYSNKGTADPFLVACALVEQQRAAGMLVAPDWRVVTDDGAVRRKAEEFGVAWMSSVEFLDTCVTKSNWS